MLTILGNEQEYSSRLRRRDFLRIGAAGPAAGLAERFSQQAFARSEAVTARESAKSVIMVYLLGGPAHLDTYDPSRYASTVSPRREAASLSFCSVSAGKLMVMLHA
jgi:hypothetical protein